jgi:hypothetical protein
MLYVGRTVVQLGRLVVSVAVAGLLLGAASVVLIANRRLWPRGELVVGAGLVVTVAAPVVPHLIRVILLLLTGREGHKGQEGLPRLRQLERLKGRLQLRLEKRDQLRLVLLHEGMTVEGGNVSLRNAGHLLERDRMPDWVLFPLGRALGLDLAKALLAVLLAVVVGVALVILVVLEEVLGLSRRLSALAAQHKVVLLCRRLVELGAQTLLPEPAVILGHRVSVSLQALVHVRKRPIHHAGTNGGIRRHPSIVKDVKAGRGLHLRKATEHLG